MLHMSTTLSIALIYLVISNKVSHWPLAQGLAPPGDSHLCIPGAGIRRVNLYARFFFPVASVHEALVLRLASSHFTN